MVPVTSWEKDISGAFKSYSKILDEVNKLSEPFYVDTATITRVYADKCAEKVEVLNSELPLKYKQLQQTITDSRNTIWSGKRLATEKTRLSALIDKYLSNHNIEFFLQMYTESTATLATRENEVEKMYYYLEKAGDAATRGNEVQPQLQEKVQFDTTMTEVEENVVVPSREPNLNGPDNQIMLDSHNTINTIPAGQRQDLLREYALRTDSNTFGSTTDEQQGNNFNRPNVTRRSESRKVSSCVSEEFLNTFPTGDDELSSTISADCATRPTGNARTTTAKADTRQPNKTLEKEKTRAELNTRNQNPNRIIETSTPLGRNSYPRQPLGNRATEGNSFLTRDLFDDSPDHNETRIMGVVENRYARGNVTISRRRDDSPEYYQARQNQNRDYNQPQPRSTFVNQNSNPQHQHGRNTQQQEEFETMKDMVKAMTAQMATLSNLVTVSMLPQQAAQVQDGPVEGFNMSTPTTGPRTSNYNAQGQSFQGYQPATAANTPAAQQQATPQQHGYQQQFATPMANGNQFTSNSQNFQQFGTPNYNYQQHGTNYGTQQSQQNYLPSPLANGQNQYVQQQQAAGNNQTGYRGAYVHKIPIPKFDGKSEDYSQWWSVFEYAIHLNQNVSDLEKLVQLKASMSGLAREIVADIPMEGNQYQSALEAIREQYDNARFKSTNLLDSLNTIQMCKFEPKAMRETFIRVKAKVQAFLLSGEPYNLVLENQIVQKFPFKLQERLATTKLEAGDNWNLPLLLSCINKFISVRESIEKTVHHSAPAITMPTFRPDPARSRSRPPFKRGDSQNRNRPFRSRSDSRPRDSERGRSPVRKFGTNYNTTSDNYKNSRSADDATAATKRCNLCDQKGHYATRCRVIGSANEKIDIAKAKFLCYKCFSTSHTVSECTYTDCPFCGKPHHGSTCLQNEDEKATGITRRDSTPYPSGRREYRSTSRSDSQQRREVRERSYSRPGDKDYGDRERSRERGNIDELELDGQLLYATPHRHNSLELATVATSCYINLMSEKDQQQPDPPNGNGATDPPPPLNVVDEARRVISNNPVSPEGYQSDATMDGWTDPNMVLTARSTATAIGSRSSSRSSSTDSQAERATANGKHEQQLAKDILLAEATSVVDQGTPPPRKLTFGDTPDIEVIQLDGSRAKKQHTDDMQEAIKQSLTSNGSTTPRSRTDRNNRARDERQAVDHEPLDEQMLADNGLPRDYLVISNRGEMVPIYQAWLRQRDNERRANLQQQQNITVDDRHQQQPLPPDLYVYVSGERESPQHQPVLVPLEANKGCQIAPLDPLDEEMLRRNGLAQGCYWLNGAKKVYISKGLLLHFDNQRKKADMESARPGIDYEDRSNFHWINQYYGGKRLRMEAIPGTGTQTTTQQTTSTVSPQQQGAVPQQQQTTTALKTGRFVAPPQVTPPLLPANEEDEFRKRLEKAKRSPPQARLGASAVPPTRLPSSNDYIALFSQRRDVATNTQLQPMPHFGTQGVPSDINRQQYVNHIDDIPATQADIARLANAIERLAEQQNNLMSNSNSIQSWVQSLIQKHGTLMEEIEAGVDRFASHANFTLNNCFNNIERVIDSNTLQVSKDMKEETREIVWEIWDQGRYYAPPGFVRPRQDSETDQDDEPQEPRQQQIADQQPLVVDGPVQQQAAIAPPQPVVILPQPAPPQPPAANQAVIRRGPYQQAPIYHPLVPPPSPRSIQIPQQPAKLFANYTAPTIHPRWERYRNVPLVRLALQRGYVNWSYDEKMLQRSDYTDSRKWYRRVTGKNNEDDCLVCDLPHFTENCPGYYLAEYRIALYLLQRRCLACKGTHNPHCLPCDRKATDDSVCKDVRCRRADYPLHDKLFCVMLPRNLERHGGNQLPPGYNADRAPRF